MWPDGRLPTGRLGELAKLTFTPSFTFSKADRIMTIGSCFAREMEHRLDTLGFDLPMKQVVLPAEERATKTQNDLLSKYTVESMENELAWISGHAPPPPEKLFLQVGEGLWHDPQLVNNVHPASLERVIERRAMVGDAFAQLPECRIVIITLGLAEAWYDHETQLYLNTAPPQAATNSQPNRFSLDVLDYNDIYSSLERIYAILQRSGHPDFKMLITVSPVPFKATFSGQDAITANTYSKAVQRAACQAFVARHDNVDYFPSFEIVTMSHREFVYERDNIHVSNSTVAYIVDSVLAAYAPEVEFQPAKVGTPKTRRSGVEENHFDMFAVAKHHFEEGELDQAAEVCRTTIDRFYDQMSDRQKCSIRGLYGQTLKKLERWDEAIAELEICTQLAPAEAEHWLKLGRVLIEAGRRREAIAALQRALEISPDDVVIKRTMTRAKADIVTPARAFARILGARPAPVSEEEA
jgi:tetratricopeptide (TPR) repeat protein